MAPHTGLATIRVLEIRLFDWRARFASRTALSAAPPLVLAFTLTCTSGVQRFFSKKATDTIQVR